MIVVPAQVNSSDQSQHLSVPRRSGSASLVMPAFLAIAGLMLVGWGVAAKVESQFVQTAIHPVSDRVLAQGERFFKYGLIIHGSLLLACGLVCAVRRRSRTDSQSNETNRDRLNQLFSLPATSAAVGSPATVLLMVVVLCLAFALRLIGLNSGLWYDEVVTLTEFVRLPYTELVRNFADQNQHPLYSVLAHGTVELFGESAWSVRLPAVLFGVASLVAVYGFARRMTSPIEAAMVTVLLAVSYHHVWFSQNARGYTTLLFFATLGSSLFVDNLQRPRIGRSVAYGIVMALALYTHLTAAFVIAAHGLIYLALLTRHVVRHQRLKIGHWFPMLGFVVAASVALQLYSLLLPQVVASFQSQAGGIRVRAWTDLSWGAAQIVNGFLSNFAGAIGAVLAVIVVGIGMISYVRSNWLVVALLLLPSCLGLGVMLLLNRHLYPRFFFPMFAFGVMVVVRGTMIVGEFAGTILTRHDIGGTWGRRGAVGLACLMITLSATSLIACYRYPKQDYAGALAYLSEVRGETDPVVSVGMAAIPMERYFAPAFATAGSVAELALIRDRNPDRPIWLIYTFRDHMESFHPDLLRVIERTFVCERTFPGTVSGGAIKVCRSTGAQFSNWTTSYER